MQNNIICYLKYTALDNNVREMHLLELMYDIVNAVQEVQFRVKKLKINNIISGSAACQTDCAHS